MKNIQTIILSGGIGYRLKEETEFKPKPMVEVGGKPVLWHIMKIYAHYGFNNFIIALGYKGNYIKDYFVNKQYYDGDFTLDETNRNSSLKTHRKLKNDNFRITFVDTGLESATGERVRRVQRYINNDMFLVTYGDGLSNINIRDLVKYHRAKKAICTITGVYPMLKYGGVDVNKNGMATFFQKKVRAKQTINGGFMVFNKSVFRYLKPDTMIEDVFEPLIKIKRLAVYDHEGFFQAMDTYQDMEDLNLAWQQSPAWKIWD